MQMYTIIRKFYSSTKDMNPDNPRETLDIWVEAGCDPLRLSEAHTVVRKLMTDKLWINQIVVYAPAIEDVDQ